MFTYPISFFKSVVSQVRWLATFVLDTLATIGANITAGGTSVTQARVRDSTNGLLIEEVPAGIAVSEGMRISYDTDEPGVISLEEVADPSFDNPSQWTTGTGWSVAGGKASCDGTQSGNSDLRENPVNGVGENSRIYRWEIVVSNYVTGTLQFFMDGSQIDATITANGTYSGNLESRPVASDGIFIRALSTFVGDVEFVSRALIIPIFLNDTAKDSGIKLHPTKTGTSGEDIFLLYTYRENVTAYSVDDKLYTTGADNHNYALTITVSGTTQGTPIGVVKANIGNVLTDGTVEYRVDSHYSNLATESINYLPHVLNESAATNLIVESTPSNVATYWPDGSDFSYVAATGYSSFATPYKTTNTNQTFRARTQAVTTLTGIEETYYLIIENVDATNTSLGIYDSTAAGWVYLADFDWTTHVLSDSQGTGTPSVALISNDGPNGGEVYRLEIKCTGTATNGRLLYIYPVGQGANTLTSIIHHAQLTEDSVVSSPIITITSTVIRATTEFLVTPTTADFLRFRLGSVNAENYLTSGTISCDYDGSSSLTFSDGTNTMTAAGARAIGDTVVIQESTGKMWVNASLEDTTGAYSPTWGEISLGNATDFRFDADLDPTDDTWKEPA